MFSHQELNILPYLTQNIPAFESDGLQLGFKDITMGAYLAVTAKQGCEEQINAAFAALVKNPDDFLVYSEKIIQQEIEYIHSPYGESQAHLRQSLNSVKDWNDFFPSLKCGTGSVKISSIDDENEDAIEFARSIVKFVLENRFLFTEIRGLDDARRFGLTDFNGDGVENGRPTVNPPSDEPTFASLPKASSQFYKLCVQHMRPDIWNAYLQFKENPSKDTWEQIRSKTIPWKGAAMGLWALVEQTATAMDGKDFGLYGRFRDDHIPPLTILRKALS